jgi:putative peptidoglycan lipid II flippase
VSAERQRTAARRISRSLSSVEPSSVSAEGATRFLARPRAIVGLAGIYAASRLLGLVREIGIAFFFGTSVAADRFSAAFVVAGLASIVVGEALYAGAVRWLGGETAERSAAFTEARYAALLAVAYRTALAATAAFALLGPVVTLLVLGRRDDPGPTIALSLALAPSVGASLFVACINARLTLERRFALLNAVTILYSAGALVGLGVIALLGSEAGPWLVAVGWSVGNLTAALLLYARARPTRAGLSSPSASALGLLRIGLPLAAAFSLVAVQGLTDRAVAARLGTGSVAALSYADRLFLLPIGFVVAALGPMVLGSLVIERQRTDRITMVTLEQLRTLVTALIPLSFVFAAFAPQLVSLTFEYGQFDTRSRELTAAALDGFAVGIATVALSLVLFRMLQAVSQLREVVALSLIAVVLNAVLSIAGGLWIGLYGVTLSTSLVATVLVTLQVWRLSRSLADSWATEALQHAVLPAIACSVLSIIVVTADHRDLAAGFGRGLALLLLAGLSAAYLRRAQQQGT